MQQFLPFTHVHPMIISSRHASHVSPLQSVSVANRSAGHPTARRQDPPAPATEALPPSRGVRPPTFVPRSTAASSCMPAPSHQPHLTPARPARPCPRPARGFSRLASVTPASLGKRTARPEKYATPAARITAACGPPTRHDAPHRSFTRQRSGSAGARIAPGRQPPGPRRRAGRLHGATPDTAALRMRGCADRPGRQCPGRSRPVPGVRAGQASRPHHAR
jgi:hypothetical protein